MAVNPTAPLPPLYYWPRDASDLALAAVPVEGLASVPAGSDYAIDAAGAWWRREPDGSWMEVPADRVPAETFPLDDPYGPCAYRLEDGTPVLAMSGRLLPPQCCSMTDRRGRQWIREDAGQAWERYVSGAGTPS